MGKTFAQRCDRMVSEILMDGNPVSLARRADLARYFRGTARMLSRSLPRGCVAAPPLITGCRQELLPGPYDLIARLDRA